MTKDYSFEIVRDMSNKYTNTLTLILEKIKNLVKDVDIETFNSSIFRKKIKVIINDEIAKMNIEKEIAKTLMSAVGSNIYEWMKGLRGSGAEADVLLIKKLLTRTRKQIKLSYRMLLSNAKSLESQIIQASNSVARDIIAEIVAAKSEGIPIGESIDSVGGLIKDFNFVDQAGRAWNPASYMEMAARTQTNSINADISRNLSNEIDNDLRIIDVQGGACEICFTFSDAIISMHSGYMSDEELEAIDNDGFNYYGTYDEAVGEGFDHPNCRCIINVYIPTVSMHSVNMDEDKNSENYLDRQTQRGMERNIRTWKLKEATALNEKQQKIAKAKTKEWQKKLNTFAKDKNLSRMRWREQISFNTTSDGAWEKNWILGKTKDLNTEFLADII